MIEQIRHLVGNTPLFSIRYSYKGNERVIHCKAESFNMTGSIKDRMALHILENAYRTGELMPGDTIVEATSGNTGISFAAIGRACGHHVEIFMPDWMSRERIYLIEEFGATVRLVSKEEGGFLGSIAMTREKAATTPNTFLPSQFENPCNSQAHCDTTGPEIWKQLGMLHLQPDAMIAGVGTGGTVMGVGEYLKGKNPGIKIHPLEPSNSPTMSTGHKVGKHRIQGISDEFIPAIMQLDKLDSIISVDDGDSIVMARKIARSLGVGVGISSGANFLGAVKVQDEMGADAVVCTFFPDSNKKYLSTDLVKPEPVKDDFISSDVELLGMEVTPIGK